ncbi:hypothetical protein GJAV_G00100340 [Gymnothorax javanicus]|nr:hypothetical protein GJAV_G00100340 [Gymnothorax javanicus]
MTLNALPLMLKSLNLGKASELEAEDLSVRTGVYGCKSSGLLVATIFCFFNGEVQSALKRQWMQYKTQWGQRRREHCSMRSTSYTATSITEDPTFLFHHDSNSEHLNGKYSDDSEVVALKTEETYA